MYKESGSGWVAVTMSSKLSFDSGSTKPVRGETITGQSSSKTATIGAVIVSSGTWGGGDAAGYMVIDSPSGAFTNNELLDGSTAGADFATADGTNAVLALPIATTQYEFINYNFFGNSDLESMFWVDSVGTAWQYDGTSTIQISVAGMTTDKPTHIAAHKYRLFLSFPGGSLQNSGAGDPWTWSGVLGANEIGVGDDITGIVSGEDGRLIIFSKNSTNILTGSTEAGGADPWVLAPHSRQSGAKSKTLQRMSEPIYLDDRGLTSLRSVAYAGDFKGNVLSLEVQPFLDTRTDNISASLVVKDKNQYRLFFDDNKALFFTFENNAVSGVTIVDYGLQITAACGGEDSSGNEILFGGSTDGFVYKLDNGTSFAGNAINSYIRLAYHHYGSPTMNKRFRMVTLEIDNTGNPSSTVTLLPEFSYSESGVVKALADSIALIGKGSIWGEGVWGTFVWGGQLVTEGVSYIDGVGRNMGLLITVSSTTQEPTTIHGVTVMYDQLNRRR
jgi:hypothetical protein